MDNTLALPIINKLADERLRLYEQASEHALTPDQRQRIAEISDRLPVLWDQYRRELAAQHGPAVQLTGAQRQQRAVRTAWDDTEKRRAA